MIFLQGGITALHIASYKDMKDTVKVLLSAKIKTDVDIQDEVSVMFVATLGCTCVWDSDRMEYVNYELINFGWGIGPLIALAE